MRSHVAVAGLRMEGIFSFRTSVMADRTYGFSRSKLDFFDPIFSDPIKDRCALPTARCHTRMQSRAVTEDRSLPSGRSRVASLSGTTKRSANMFLISRASPQPTLHSHATENGSRIALTRIPLCGVAVQTGAIAFNLLMSQWCLRILSCRRTGLELPLEPTTLLGR